MQKRIITLETIIFYLIALISPYLLLLFVIFTSGLLKSEDLEFIFIWSLYFIFPALATYGYNTYIVKAERKKRVIKRILWVVLISFNTLIPIIPIAFPFDKDRSLLWIVFIAFATFMASIPLLISLLLSTLNPIIIGKIKQKCTPKKAIVFSVLLYFLTGLIIWAFGTGAIFGAILRAPYLFNGIRRLFA